MTIIKLIALIIFIISCITIYHNTNSFEPKKRIIYIAIGMVVMYGLTSVLCALKSNGIEINNTEANNTFTVIKMIFTPINAIIFLAPLGNIVGKAYDKTITTESAGKRLLVLLIIFVIIIIFETNYIGNFITNLLG